MRNCLVMSGMLAFSLPLACSAGSGNSAQTSSTAPHNNTLAVPADGQVASIVTMPLTLTPSFSTSIQDYYVRCATGTNALTLTVTDAASTTTTAVDLVDDQATVVGGQYWIRCLPPDFPAITVTHSGTPTPGSYRRSATRGTLASSARASSAVCGR